MRTFASFLLLSVMLGVSGCGSSSATTQPQAPTSGRPPPDVCAGDPWLAQLLGTPPTISSTMRLEQMQRLMAGTGHTMDRIQMDHLYEMNQVMSASAENFEWDGPTNGGQPRVIVLRKAFGDPRQLKSERVPLYGAPRTLSPTLLEYPPTPEAAAKDEAFQSRGGRTLFTFSDGTWVRVDTWMAPRLRAAFAQNGPPPPPAAPPDVAWEICASRNPQPGLTTIADRMTLHMLVGRDHPIDMFFRYGSPELAARAEGEHRFFCQQNPHDPRKDKGIFQFRPPCEHQATSAVEGPYLHYVIRTRPF